MKLLSFESVQSNACVHGPDLGLYSHPKELLGVESEPMLTPMEKSCQPDDSEDGGTFDAGTGRTVSPTHYQLRYRGPKVPQHNLKASMFVTPSLLNTLHFVQ